MGSTMWQCEQVRAGQVWGRMLFPTRGEAETFLKHMQRAEPDIFWKLDEVPASAVWN